MVPCRYVILTKVERKCDREGCTRENCMITDWQWSLPSGEPLEKLEFGDVYVNDAHAPTPEAARAYGCPWDNCDGKHMMCVLPPDGHAWNIDSRASNCTLKEDRTHRCWVRRGDPSKGELHVDKNGYTCAAGAGSIICRGKDDQGRWIEYHGHLHNFALTEWPQAVPVVVQPPERHHAVPVSPAGQPQAQPAPGGMNFEGAPPAGPRNPLLGI